MRNILRLRVLGILLLALGLFGGTAASVSAAPATPGAPSGVASVTISAFTSDQVAVPTLVVGGAADAEEGAGFTEATFEFYLNGTGDPIWVATTTNGDAQVNDAMPAGDYTIVLTDSVWDSPYGYSWDVTLAPSGALFLTVLIPSGEAPGFSDSGSLVVSSFAAEQVGGTTCLVSDPINVPPQGPAVFQATEDDLEDQGYVGAYRVDREFYIYLNGDTTSDPYGLQTIGGTALFDNLPEGTHLLVDAQTGDTCSFSILEGFVTSVTVVFPEGAGDTGNAEGDRDTEAPGAGDDGNNGDDGENGDDGDNGSTGGKTVSKLPSTGQGGDTTDSSAIILVLGAMSLVALAGGFAWRQRRTA